MFADTIRRLGDLGVSIPKLAAKAGIDWDALQDAITRDDPSGLGDRWKRYAAEMLKERLNGLMEILEPGIIGELESREQDPNDPRCTRVYVSDEFGNDYDVGCIQRNARGGVLSWHPRIDGFRPTQEEAEALAQMRRYIARYRLGAAAG